MTMTIPATDESARLAVVRRYDILDSPPDGAFDRITKLAARLLGVPIAIVSIVDSDRIWFKSHHGVEIDQVDREPGLCASAVMQDEPWLVTNAASDPRTLTNPLVAGELGLRFYAGVPLRTHDGYNLGTLCVIDANPREITTSEVETLEDLAALVMDEIELRLSSRTTLTLEAELRRSAERVANALQENLIPAELPAIAGFDLTARYHVANRGQVGGDFYDAIKTPDGCMLVVGDACGKGTDAAALTGTARWTLRTVALDHSSPALALDRLNQVLAGAYPKPTHYCTVALASLESPASGSAKLTVALGGHPPPLLVRRNGAVERVGSLAAVVGWRPEVTYGESTVEMFPSDLLLLFTDGLPEALAGKGHVSDTPLTRLLSTLADKSVDDVADALDAQIGDGDLTDDAAYLVVRCA